jgi:hypothetical protein
VSISDGFNLWLGKALAELAIFGATMALLALGCGIYVVVTCWPRKSRRRP